MKIRITIISALLLLSACTAKVPYGETVSLDQATLMDKIRGGWYGQTIGCTYGGPTEFKYKGGLIMDEIPIPWYDNYIYDTYIEDPGLYDDVYMDLTFLETMLKEGLDAPIEAYADAFAYADYKLWHANQAARYNIMNGRSAPESGHWKYNPHADDIDFQIEADFIGMLYPGQVNKASELSDRIGHIMNYGDGWYGGVYIGAMYCLAYVCQDIPTIVSEALKTIPEGTKFHNTIADVIKYWKKYPNDWKQCWFEVTNRHANDVGCPEGVWNGFNIDATINSAFVVICLLYGEGDYLIEYEKLIKELSLEGFVELPGYIRNVASCIREDGIFVLSSDFEGIPNALIEAMSVGLPCVATDCTPGGPAFLTNNGERGLLVPIQDVDAMAGAIISLIEGPSLAASLAKKATDIVSLLNIDVINKMWIDSFKNIINDGK